MCVYYLRRQLFLEHGPSIVIIHWFDMVLPVPMSLTRPSYLVVMMTRLPGCVRAALTAGSWRMPVQGSLLQMSSSTSKNLPLDDSLREDLRGGQRRRPGDGGAQEIVTS
jgi:hypothetical protein